MDEMHDNGRTIDAAGAAQTLPSLFDAGSHSAPATPQSTLRSTAPLRGAPSGRGAADAPAPNPRREALPQTGAREPNLCREALPLPGEVPSAHTEERGRQSSDTSRVKKTASTQNPPVGDGPRAVPKTSRPAPHDKLTYPPQAPCHCGTSSQIGRGNPRPNTPHINPVSPQRKTDSHVDGAPRDGGISRFTKQPPSPFRGNDKGGLNPAVSFPNRQSLTPGDPSVSLTAASSPKRGAESDTPKSPLLRAHFARLCAEADALHRADPGFDLDSALRDPAFVRLTAPDVGVPVADAWYALHRREYAETLRRESLEQAAAAVASGSLRPREGGRASGGELLGTDPRRMTAAQRAELRDRIKRGERVYPR